MNFKIRKTNTWTLCLFLILVFTFSGNGQVLCIGEDGHIELETFCLPCCSDPVKICDPEMLDEAHGEHSECSSCSDIELSDFLWSGRNSHDDFNRLSSTIAKVFVVNIHSLNSLNHNISRVNQNYLSFSLSPPLPSIETAVLRC